MHRKTTTLRGVVAFLVVDMAEIVATEAAAVVVVAVVVVAVVKIAIHLWYSYLK